MAQHKRVSFLSIRGRSLIFGLCISLLPIAIITTVYYFNDMRMLRKQTHDWLTAIAESKKTQVIEFMEEKKKRTIDISSDGFIRDSLGKIKHGEALEENTLATLSKHLLVNKKPLDVDIIEVNVMDMDGNVVASTDTKMIGQNISKQDVFTEGKKAAHAEQHTFSASTVRTRTVSISVPVSSKGGAETLGVVANVYDLAALSKITTNRAGMRETGEVYIVDSDGIMLTESRFIEDAPLKVEVDTEPVSRIGKGGGEMVGIYPNYRGVSTVGASSYIPEYGWTLLAEIDKREAFAPLKVSGITALIVGLSSAGAAAGVAIVFAFSISGTLRKLTDATERFTHGDLKSRVRITRKDEIGNLADSFNKMAEELENELVGHKRAEDALSERAKAQTMRADIGNALTAGTTLREMLQSCTEILVRYPEVVFARIWLLNMEDNVLELQASAGMYTHIDGPHSCVPVGQLEIGKIAATQQRFLTNDVRNQPWISDRKWAERKGIVAFAGYPLVFEGRSIGVMAIFSCEPLTKFLLDALALQIADIAIAIEHKQAEKKIAEHAAELAEVNVQLKELDQLKSMFIASMSHELRTPLNSIIGFAGILLQDMVGELNPKQKDYLGRLNRSAKHLLGLINDVIDISKIEAGKVEAFAEEFALNEVINEAIEIVQPQLKEKELALELSVSPEIRLNTDKKRVLQCILNYISNAIRYTESGTITVATREIDGEVEITVSDTGIGIEEEKLPQLFMPFMRLDSPLRTKVLGTGLGLYLTKKLATAVLGGTIAVQSQLGKGSKFSLRLPKELKHKNANA